jgi:hypothetical protein
MTKLPASLRLCVKFCIRANPLNQRMTKSSACYLSSALSLSSQERLGELNESTKDERGLISVNPLNLCMTKSSVFYSCSLVLWSFCGNFFSATKTQKHQKLLAGKASHFPYNFLIRVNPLNPCMTSDE